VKPLVLGCAAAFLLLPAGATDAAGLTATGKWTQPAILSECPGTGALHVVFPEDSPTQGTGPGAIVWSASSPCPAGVGVQVAAISPEGIPGAPIRPRTAAGRTIALRGPLDATAGPHGRVVIAGTSAERQTGTAGGLLLTEGRAGGPFAPPLTLGGRAGTFSFATAYLGDAALASLADSHGRTDLQLRVQRYYASAFAPPARVSATGSGGVEALTVALDFRSDRLVVFSRDGSLFARELPGKGAPHALQRLGPSPPAGAHIAAVLSDDNRAIVAWTVRHDGQTSVYVSHSQPGVRFAAPQLLEEFPDPPGLPGYVDSPQLIRLSSESVVLAWTGAVAGHWAIRAAAIDQGGVLPPSTLSPAGSDALLAGLAPGPNDEALALWTQPQPTPAGLDLGSQAIFAARGFDGYPEQVKFAAPELLAPPGPNSDATVAFDPDSDRAVAAWRTGAGALAYSVRAPGAP